MDRSPGSSAAFSLVEYSICVPVGVVQFKQESKFNHYARVVASSALYEIKRARKVPPLVPVARHVAVSSVTVQAGVGRCISLVVHLRLLVVDCISNRFSGPSNVSLVLQRRQITSYFLKSALFVFSESV